VTVEDRRSVTVLLSDGTRPVGAAGSHGRRIILPSTTLAAANAFRQPDSRRQISTASRAAVTASPRRPNAASHDDPDNGALDRGPNGSGAPQRPTSSGGLAAAFKALVVDAVRTTRDIAHSAAAVAEKSADIEDRNLRGLLDSDSRASDAFNRSATRLRVA
jgi:hypothetical protein